MYRLQLQCTACAEYIAVRLHHRASASGWLFLVRSAMMATIWMRSIFVLEQGMKSPKISTGSLFWRNSLCIHVCWINSASLDGWLCIPVDMHTILHTYPLAENHQRNLVTEAPILLLVLHCSMDWCSIFVTWWCKIKMPVSIAKQMLSFRLLLSLAAFSLAVSWGTPCLIYCIGVGKG